MMRSGSRWTRGVAAIPALAAATLATTTMTASAQNYPNKPIRLLVGFVAGGSTDLAGRFIAPQKDTFKKLSWTFGLQNQITDSLLLYANTRRSYSAPGSCSGGACSNCR